MKKIWSFICDKSLIFMVTGMVVLLIGLLILIFFRMNGGPKEAAITIGIIGFAIYVVGRIAHFLKKSNTTLSSDSMDA
jgi:uncharacterized membrane protein YecN with MAPEG domain